MRRILVITLSLLAGLAVVAPAPAQAGTGCGPGQGLLSGRVFDAATTAPLNDVTSVGIHGVSVKVQDGIGTAEDTFPRELGDYFSRVRMPALRVAGFNMSSVSRAS